MPRHPARERGDIVHELIGKRLHRFVARPRNVRRQDECRMRQNRVERMRGRQRLLRDHVEPRARDLPRLQCVDERAFPDGKADAMPA